MYVINPVSTEKGITFVLTYKQGLPLHLYRYI